MVLLISGILIAAVSLGAGCGGGTPSGKGAGTTTPPAAGSKPQESQEPIKIGVSLPLTGDAAVWGKSQKDGYELALDHIRKQAGINGREVVLIYGDDAGLPREGISVLRKFIDVDHIDALTGVANSSVALAFIPIINEEKLLFISSGASSPELTGASPYFFRTWPSDIAEALAMAKYAREEMKLESVACLYINNDYGTGLVGPFTEALEKRGGKVIGSESFEQNTTDVRAQLTKVKALQPQAIYLAGNPREMARCITQARELGINTQFLSISTLNDKEVLSTVSQTDLEGTIITDASFNPASTRPEAQRFMTAFREKFDADPGILANTAYDALMILAKAIKEANMDPDALAAFLHKMEPYPGVAGSITFGQGGDVNRPIRIASAETGNFNSIVDDYRWFD
ncbi:MAG: ABC transporter substrate-binding protein [Candidatus Hydrogenedentes bacterium]|nr:ABC transporter substrate-binding protein [Candidatus Hydrogenedentota bacterium]